MAETKASARDLIDPARHATSDKQTLKVSEGKKTVRKEPLELGSKP